MTVYTFGYRGRTVDELAAEMERLNAIAIDVRYRPFGRGPNQTWSRKTLKINRWADSDGPRPVNTMRTCVQTSATADPILRASARTKNP